MFEFERLRNTLKQIGDLRLLNLSKIIGWDNGKPPGGTTVEAGHAMFLWLANKLCGCSYPYDQVDIILYKFRAALIWYGREVSKVDRNTAATAPVSLLAIADKRYVSMSGDDQFLDLRTGNSSGAIPSMPGETHSFNLCTIWLRGRDRYNNLSNLATLEE